jgi:hypothetical protein
MVPLHEIRDAASFDRTLRHSEKFSKALSARYLAPQPYSHKKLYDHMYAGKTVVFTNYPLDPGLAQKETLIDGLVRKLKQGLPKNEKIYIRTGPKRTLKKVTIQDTIERWLRQRSKFGVTDLHFRNTRFYDNIDAEALTYFNLLVHCPYEVSFLEMLTLVISSRGIFSDSHSDDGDGSNHCFVGKKLWLAWDRLEGKKVGLQDCTYDPVYDQAKFSLEKFSQLKTAHWFLVQENQTLFMPGNFSHKVITLEPYIGFGSFYVTLPGYVNTLKRWLLEGSSDVKGDFIDIMNKYASKKIAEIRRSGEAAKQKWGYTYLNKAVHNWKDGLTKTEVARLSGDKKFTSFIQLASGH